MPEPLRRKYRSMRYAGRETGRWLWVLGLVACKAAVTPSVDASLREDSSVQDAGPSHDARRTGDGGLNDLDAGLGDAAISDSGPDVARRDAAARDATFEDAARDTSGDMGTEDAGALRDGGRIVTGGTLCRETDVSKVEGEVVLDPSCVLTVTRGLVIDGSLRGAGPFSSTIRIPAGALGVTLAPGAILEGVSIESAGVYALAAMGADAAQVDNVRIEAERGVGLFVDSSTAAEFSEVEVFGGVDPLTVDDDRWDVTQGAPADYVECLGCECNPGDSDESLNRVCSPEGVWVTWTAVIGAFVKDSAVTMDHVVVRNFAGYGMAFDHATATTMNGTSVWGTVGVGIRLDSSDVSVTDLYVDSTHDGVAPGTGVLVDDASSFATNSASIAGQAYGVVSGGGAVSLVGGNVLRSQEAALWLGPGSAVALSGTGIEEFAGAGMTAVDVDSLVLRNVSFARADTTTSSTGYGDSVVLIRPPSGTLFETVWIRDNRRAGLLVGADAPTDPRPSYSGDGPGMTIMLGATRLGSYGALIGQVDAVRGVIDLSHPEDWAEWQTGLSRDVTAQISDASPPSELSYAYGALPPGFGSIIGPSYLAGPSAIVGPMF